MRFLVLLLIASTAVAKTDTITRGDIVKTLHHVQELARTQGAELDSAKANITDLNHQLDGALGRIDEAHAEVVKVQATIDAQRKEIAEKDKQIKYDAEKIAKYHHLLRIVCTILATVAALLVFEMLKPTGMIGAMFTFQPWIRYAAPVVVWGIVFGASWAYF